MKTKFFLTLALTLLVLSAAGCGKKADKQSTISVVGTGTVLVQPDMIQMTITMSKISPTTKAAQEEVSKMVRQALQILKAANIEDKNISTASLNFRSEYDYEYGRTRVLLGQKAEQSITFSIENINDDTEKVSAIIDQLIGINGIELNRINFSVKNSTEYFIRSRELAFQKAEEKAEQYAELSKLKTIKVLSISEEGTQQISTQSNRQINNMALAAEAAYDTNSTVLPMGELEITTRISVLFLME